ncbi:hypothetical protein VSDG_01400 [Cytospora chrysosperma]|uniref:Heterokaryon incompatibility domain-containing protein n=1 Tax=Cytospora chrysosperma TaxID=252740 RepID=A0A423WJN2_CYTCH|nr:hypothetical protein VSDG_01400 [Valsa sordida]
MRLLDTTSLKLREFAEDKIPPYAILSHTWGAPNEEVSFQDMQLDTTTLEKDRKYGYSKIVKTCRFALKGGLEYAWVDTCCIDKSSSAELTEAINSMFRWYEKAVICYVYLADVKPQMHLEQGLKRCRWITRGWTLQELIAPRECQLFDSEWKYRGRKTELKEMLAKLTGVPASVLAKEMSPRDYSVAQRMSWAAMRTTTRTEDVAYCLMGLFGIHMPMIYGEGDMAFHRLQEEILKRSDDPTIFTGWEPPDGAPDILSILAPSPAPFKRSGNLVNPVGFRSSEFTLTNKGVKIVNAPVLWLREPPTLPRTYLLVLDGGTTKREMAGIYLRKVDGNLFCRINKRIKVSSDLQQEGLRQRTVSEIYVADFCTFPITRSVILESRKSAVQILGPDGFHIDNATPQRVWDYTDSCFLGGAPDAPLVQWVQMQGIIRGQSVSLIILCDRRAENGCGTPALSVIEKCQSVKFYKYLNQKAWRQGKELTWSEVKAVNAALLHHTESTEIPFKDAVLKICVSVAKGMVSTREGDIQMYQAKVDFKRGKRSSAKDK